MNDLIQLRERLRLLPLALGALTVTAGLATGQEPDLPWKVPGGAERAKRVMQDAQRYAHSHLPSPDELGAGWRRPWELPGSVPGGFGNEDRFWRSVRPDDDSTHWIWFYGLSRHEARAVLQEPMEEMRAEMAKWAGEVPADHPLAAMASPPNFLRFFIGQNRMKNALFYESHPVFAVRKKDVLMPILRAKMGGKRDSEETQVEMVRLMFEEMTPELEGASFDTILDAYVREVTNVRKFTTMAYVYVSDEALKNAGAGSPPEYATFTVSVHVVSRDTLGKEVRDVAPGELPELRSEMEAHLNALAEELAPGVGVSYRVRAEPLEAGDAGWVLAIDASSGALPGMASMAGVFGRLRNGNALVDVKAEGTYSSDWLAKQMHFVLAALDERTSMYTEDEWE